jgi:hypothetical protein
LYPATKEATQRLDVLGQRPGVHDLVSIHGNAVVSDDVPQVVDAESASRPVSGFW